MWGIYKTHDLMSPLKHVFIRKTSVPVEERAQYVVEAGVAVSVGGSEVRHRSISAVLSTLCPWQHYCNMPVNDSVIGWVSARVYVLCGRIVIFETCHLKFSFDNRDGWCPKTAKIPYRYDRWIDYCKALFEKMQDLQDKLHRILPPVRNNILQN